MLFDENVVEISLVVPDNRHAIPLVEKQVQRYHFANLTSLSEFVYQNGETYLA